MLIVKPLVIHGWVDQGSANDDKWEVLLPSLGPVGLKELGKILVTRDYGCFQRNVLGGYRREFLECD